MTSALSALFLNGLSVIVRSGANADFSIKNRDLTRFPQSFGRGTEFRLDISALAHLHNCQGQWVRQTLQKDTVTCRVVVYAGEHHPQYGRT